MNGQRLGNSIRNGAMLLISASLMAAPALAQENSAAASVSETASTTVGSVLTPAAIAKVKLGAWDQANNPVERYHDYLNAHPRPTNDAPGGFAGRLDGSEHLQFATQEEAFAWYRSFAQIFAKITKTEVAELVLPTDPKYSATYKRLTDGVHRLWASYKVLFPEQTNGLNEPWVLLRHTDEVNAFITRDPKTDKIVHAINVNTGIVDLKNLSDEELFGVIGHELAHSVFRHALPKYQSRVVKYFNRAQFAGHFSYEAVNDANVNEIATSYIDHAGDAGDLVNDQLQDLPSIGLHSPTYLRILVAVLNSVDNCAPTLQTMQSVVDLENMDMLSTSISINPSDLSKITDLSKQARTGLSTCTKGYKMTLSKIVAAIMGMSEDEVRGKIPQDEEQLFDSQPDLGSAIAAGVHMHRAAMKSLESRFPMANVGVYTFEEHADDVGAIVLAHAGLRAPEFGNMFLEFIKENPSVAQRCDAILKRGEEPPMGSLSDPHRASCYRADHIRKLANSPEFKRDIVGFASRFLQATYSER